MIQLYVKKLTSVSPDKYEYITFDNAISLYNEYLGYHFESEQKQFTEWLNTEI